MFPSKLWAPFLTENPALGIPDTGRVHEEDLEPSHRKSQTTRDDRPSLNIQASKQERFPQLNPVKLPEMDVWGRDWVERCVGTAFEKQTEVHSETNKDAMETWGKEPPVPMLHGKSSYTAGTGPGDKDMNLRGRKGTGRASETQLPPSNKTELDI